MKCAGLSMPVRCFFDSGVSMAVVVWNRTPSAMDQPWNPQKFPGRRIGFSLQYRRVFHDEHKLAELRG